MRFQPLPTHCISPNPRQPRRHFDAHQLQELADSIASQGLIEPLIVRQEGEHFVLIAGERRWRAAVMLEMERVACVIVDYSDQQAAAVSLIENIQRVDLTLIEEARGYEQLRQSFHLPQDDLARMVGKSRSHITNMLRLLTLDEQVQNWVEEDRLTFGHARTLVGLSTAAQRRFGQLAIRHQWSVRQMEDKIKTHKRAQVRGPTCKNNDISRLEAQMSEQLGTQVICQPEDVTGGWLKIKYYDNETLAGILDRLGLDCDD